MSFSSRIKRHSRLALGPLDQGVTSIGNFVLSIAIASTSTVGQFGQFALLYSLYWFLTGLCRAIIGESALSEDGESRRKEILSAPLYLGLGIGVLGGAVGIALGIAFSTPLLAFGSIAFPFLIAQDVSRYVAFTFKAPSTALASDLIMLAVQIFLGAILTIALNLDAAPSWIGAWGLGALAGLTFAVVKMRMGRNPRGTRAWLVHHRKLSSSVGIEFFLNTGSQQLVVFLIPIAAGLGVLGSLKAAQVAIGPLNVLLTSLSLLVLPLLFRAFGDADVGRAKKIYAISLSVVTLAGIVYAAVIALLPESVLASLFGPSWAGAMPAAVIIAAQTIATGIAQVGAYMLRSAGFAARSTILRGIVLPFVLVLPILGAVQLGSTGAALGLLVSSCISAIVWTVTVIRVLKITKDEHG